MSQKNEDSNVTPKNRRADRSGMVRFEEDQHYQLIELSFHKGRIPIAKMIASELSQQIETEMIAVRLEKKEMAARKKDKDRQRTMEEVMPAPSKRTKVKSGPPIWLDSAQHKAILEIAEHKGCSLTSLLWSWLQHFVEIETIIMHIERRKMATAYLRTVTPEELQEAENLMRKRAGRSEE